MPLWYNSTSRTKRRNQWRKNSGPCRQLRKGWLWFLFSVSFLCAISSIFHTQELGRPLKSNNLDNGQFFFLLIVYSIYKQYLEFPEKCHCGRRVALHKLVIARNDLQQYIYEPYRKYHQQSNIKFSGLPTYDIRSLGCIIYHLLFGSPLCNFDCQ